MGEEKIMTRCEKLTNEAIEIYKDLLTENISILKIIREGNAGEIKKALKQWKQDSITCMDAYPYALDMMNLCSTKFFVQGIDITNAMREVVYLDDYGAYYNTNWEEVLGQIQNYEQECFREYMCCVMGEKSSKKEPVRNYKHYLELVRKVNTFKGVSSKQPHIDNPKALRNLVHELVEEKKKCMLIANFTINCIPQEHRPYLNKSTITYEQALIIARDVIDNVEKTFRALDSFTESDVIGEVVDGSSKLCKQVDARFVTNYIESAGVDRRLYTKYLNNPSYMPDKKLVLVLGIFCEPFCNINNPLATQMGIELYLEQFMNQHSFSMKSQCSTITEYDVMTDRDFLNLIKDGVSVEILAYMLNNYARTKKDFNS